MRAVSNGGRSPQIGVRRAPASLSGIVTDALNMMGTQAGAAAIVAHVQGTLNGLDFGLGVVDGITPVLNRFPSQEQNGAAVALVSGLGHIAAAVDSLGHDIGAAAKCSATPGCDPGPLAAEVGGTQAQIVSAFWSTYASVPIVLGLEQEAASARLISQAADSLSTYGNVAAAARQADATDVNAVAPSALAGWVGRLGSVTGTVNIANALGPAAAQSSLALCCLGAGQLGITGLADPSGAYSMLVPTQVSGSNYRSLRMSVVDIGGGGTLASEIVDLSGLSASTPVQVPPMAGTCSDPGAMSPDGDDPDCD